MKKRAINWMDVLFGFLAGSVFWLLIYVSCVVPKITKPAANSTDTASTGSEEAIVKEEVKAYQTNIKSFTFELSEGKSVTFTTPESFYSLTDQYYDELYEYYGTEGIHTNNMFVVGDGSATNECKVMINSATLSAADEILSALYGDSYDSSTDLQSEVLTYIKTGSLPEELPDNYYLCDLGQVTVGGITYRMFDKYYTSSYSYYEEEDTAQTNEKTIEVPYYEFVAYSDTEDTIETIVYMTEYDVNSAYEYFCEFIGTEATELGEGTVIVGELPSEETVEKSEEVTPSVESEAD